MTQHSTLGWFNYHRACGQRIWLAARDVGKTHMARWTDQECTTRHECTPVAGAGSSTPATGNQGTLL